jgi:phenylacetate-CoA ligase
MTPATITCSASVMTESARQSIKTAFGITPHDLLGCNEIGRIGVECIGDEGALSVFSDIRHVDIVDSTGSAIHDSKDGFLLVTNFDTRVMPLIKYRLGDVTHFMAGSGQYGLPFPRIAQVSGRETDYITDANGCKVFGLNAAFDDYPDAVFRHQWVVHAPGHVTLKCVLNRMNPDAEKEVRAVRDEWLTRLAGRMDIALEFVEHIADEAGKIRFIIHE